MQPYISPILNFDSKTILITGAAGFIGSNLVSYFASNYPKARILALDYFRDGDTFSNGNPTTLGHFKNLNLYANIDIICTDISNVNDMRKLKHYGKIDYIFHEAAISDTTCMNMNRVLKVNLHAFRSIINLALRNDASLIYASSAAVYGNTKAPNSVGRDEIPENIYGFSKLCMDMENVKRQAEFYGKQLALIGLRYFNVYGRGEFYKGKTSSMILQLGLQALYNGKVRLFKYGQQQRDFVHIDDVVQANIRALETLDSNKDSLLDSCFDSGAVYNVGSGVSSSFNSVVEILRNELGITFEIEYINNPYSFFQNHTLADTVNFVPKYKPIYSLESGIKEYIPTIIEIYEDIKIGKKNMF